MIALLRDASIPVCVFDANISALEAGIGVFSAQGYGAVLNGC